MNAVLTKAIIALVPAGLLVGYSVAVFTKRRSLPASLQLAGSVCLVIVVLTHVCEALGLFPFMRFGQPDSAGHYLDLASALLGATLLPAAVLLRVTRIDLGRALRTWLARRS